MSLSITQNPALVSLAQSPIIFTVAESDTNLLTSSSFQYVGELFYWTGSVYQSSSVANYTIVKYPNTAGAGIFDLNRIINSTLTDLAFYNTSNVQYYLVDFYWQWLSGSTFITGSHTKSDLYKALDGYGVFQEPIGQSITSASAYWPIMTSGPATQSVLITNRGTSGAYVGQTNGITPTSIEYVGNTGAATVLLSGSTLTTDQIQQYPVAPSQPGFPISTSGLEYYTIQALSGSTPISAKIQYDVVCNEKYPNVRIKWKNRFGQFDWLNFNMISRQSFETERKTYQPQLGTWESSTLSYQRADSANLAYIVDSKQGLTVNTNWLPESYNDILKELLVSEEIYWVYDETNNYVRPLTIITNNIQFKTGVVDKLIQYTFEFQYGQPYKLIM